MSKKKKIPSIVWGLLLFGIFEALYMYQTRESKYDKYQEECNDPNSKYYNPRPEPGRAVLRFDYDNNCWVYKDQVDLRSKAQVERDLRKPSSNKSSRVNRNGEKVYILTEDELEDWAEEYLEDKYDLESDPW